MQSNRYVKKFFERSLSSIPLAKCGTSSFGRSKSMNGLDNRSSMLILEELVQCGICLDQLTDSRMLPCQHTFCLECLRSHLFASAGRKMKNQVSKEELREIVEKTNNDLQCPTCQKSVNIGEGTAGLQKLPLNFYIDSLLQVVENEEGPEESVETRCAKCQTVCQSDGEHCKHCKQVFCKVCWGEHMAFLRNNFVTLQERLEEAEARLKHKLRDFHDYCEQVAGNIRNTTEERISKIQDQEEDALKQLDDIKMREDIVAVEVKERLSKIRTEMGETTFISSSNDSAKVDTFLTYHRCTSKLLNEVSHVGEVRVVFDPKNFTVGHRHGCSSQNSADAPRVPENPRSLTKFYQAKKFTPKLVWTKCPRPAGVGIPPWDPDVLYITATDRKTVLVLEKTSFKVMSKLSCPEMLHPHSIAFSGDEVFVSDKWKHCIHVFSPQGDYLRSFGALGGGGGELRSPEGVAFLNNKLIVCDAGNDRVVFLDPATGQQLLVLGIRDRRTEFQAPSSVAVYQDKIVVTDTGNHRVKIFSEDGKKLLEFGSFGNNKGQFKAAEAVTCDPLGFILVGDAGNGRIQVFNPDGTLVKVLGSFGEGPGQFSWISGLLVTPQMEIIVTDYKNRRIQVF